MSRGLNKVQLIGHLGRDPEVRPAPSGSPVANFTLAVNRGRRDGTGQLVEEAEWFRVILWDHLAETAERFLRKGSLVYVEGRLQSRKYTDREGIERVAVEIVGGDLLLLPDGRQGHDGEAVRGDGATPAAPAPRRAVAPAPPANDPTPRPAGRDPFPRRDIDDVPFD